jgi:ring-1,2-phenylacetyl-CoA epoxidase subunit PaaC
MLHDSSLFIYTLHLADDALVLGQRSSEWTGHGPVLEQDIAITNIALDYLGQARNFYQLAAELYGSMNAEAKAESDKYIPRLWKSYGRELQEDDLAFLRDGHQYLNHLLVELPKGDWAFTVLRQFFFSAYQQPLYEALSASENPRIRAIAEKSLKEVTYHLRWSAEWVIRLGDGTEESSEKIRQALSELWMFTGELFEPAGFELEMTASRTGADVEKLKEGWMKKVEEVFSEAALEIPTAKSTWHQSGGKKGIHTEHLGFMLAEMQHLQRAYPNATW